MIIFETADHHQDPRRIIDAYNPPEELLFPPKEIKLLVVTDEGGATLGNHSHDYLEIFLLSAGSCEVITWKEDGDVEKRNVSAPCLFAFEPGEEHRLVCSQGTSLIGLLPKVFCPEHHIPATHLD